MKKAIFTLLVTVLTLSLTAQNEAVQLSSFKAPFDVQTGAKTNDTLYPASAALPCFDTLTVYGAASFGYVSGNNSFGDKEKAQRFLNPGSGTISSVLVYALAKSTTGTSSVKIYSVDPVTKKPSTALGTSTPVALTAVVVGNLTPYNFTTPVAFSGEFATSVVLPTGATDTLVVVTTKNGCFSNDSLTWEMQSDNNWYSFVTQWTSGGIGIKIDMIIFPVVQTVVGMTPVSAENLVSIYPNPATDYINIAAMTRTANIVFNTMGQLVNEVVPSDNILKYDVSSLQRGMYILQVLTSEGMVAKTISVQ